MTTDRPAPPIYLPPEAPDQPAAFPAPPLATDATPAAPPPYFDPPPDPEAAREAWITDADLAAAALRLAQLLPPAVGLIAAVPRSGFTLAALVACHRHLPLAEFHPTAGLRWLQSGHRYTVQPRPAADHPAVAVVDDTLAGGTALAKLAGQLAALRSTGRPVYTAVGFANPELAHLVDFHAAPLPLPHYLAWNFWNSIHARAVATDFDGILCPDYQGAATDEGPRYLAHLAAAPALAWPAAPLAAIVTARLEKYRPQTAAWLRRHRIEAAELVMAPQATAADRAARLDPGAYKAAWYGSSAAALFVESCPAQAATIARITRRPVLCPPARLAWNC